jgi:hypothetical protein
LVNDKKFNFDQGMAPGGSSAMNACVFVPPPKVVTDGAPKQTPEISDVSQLHEPQN